MGPHDLKNKLKGERGKKKLFLHIRIAGEQPAQAPGGRRSTVNPSQSGRHGTRPASQAGAGRNRTLGIFDATNIQTWKNQLKVKYRGEYTDEQYDIWATAIANEDCPEDMLTPPTTNPHWQKTGAEQVARSDDTYVPPMDNRNGVRRPAAAGGTPDASAMMQQMMMQQLMMQQQLQQQQLNQLQGARRGQAQLPPRVHAPGGTPGVPPPAQEGAFDHIRTAQLNQTVKPELQRGKKIYVMQEADDRGLVKVRFYDMQGILQKGKIHSSKIDDVVSTWETYGESQS